MKRQFCLLIICLLPLVVVFGQTPQEAGAAERIDALFHTEKLSYEQAAAFVLEAADIPTAPTDAFRYAAEQKWLPKNAGAGDTARLDALSLLVMKAFGLKGGGFYNISQSAHYAYRELQYRNMVEGNTGPAMPVSGETLFFILGRALSLTEKL